MYRLSGNRNLTYRCAIALQIAKKDSRSPGAIASQIAAAVSPPLEATDGFRIKASPAGELDCQVSDRAVADWLQNLLVNSMTSIGADEYASLASPDCFHLQYPHARYCSLLFLGHQERLIQLHFSPSKTHPGQWLAPTPVPWLSAAGSLRFCQAAEQQLLALLIDGVDRSVATDSDSHWLKFAGRLGEAMLNFDRDCRIGSTAPLELAQARLGLVAIAQALLRWLLQVKIGVRAIAQL